MGDQADLTLEWGLDEWAVRRAEPVPKRKLMAMLKKRRHRKRYVKGQKFTDEDFYTAIGRQVLEWEYALAESGRGFSLFARLRFGRSR